MKRSAIVLSIVLMPTLSHASKWVLYGVDTNKTIYSYLDLESLRILDRSNKIVKVLGKNIYKIPMQDMQGNDFDYSIADWNVDCNSQAMQQTSAKYFSKSGKLISENSWDYRAWMQMDQRSVGGIQIKMTCEKAGFK